MPYTPPSRSVSHNRTNSITASGQDAFRNFMSHKNDSATSIASRKKFYLLDGDTSEESIVASSQEKKPLSPLSYNNEITKSPYLNNILPNSTMPDIQNESSETSNNASKLLKFTTESPQSYSYTLMSTNSLALRLNVLKRSLEILLDRPEWLSCNISMDPFPILNLDSQGNVQSLPQPKAKILNNPIKEMIRLERNASSSTLQSLLQSAQRSRDGTPNISRLSTMPSSPPNKILASNNSSIVSTGTSPISVSISPTLESIKMDQTMLDDLKELIELLENDIEQPQLTTDQTDKVINLHNLSLSNAEEVSKKTFLKIQLLHALATPFIEQNSTQKLAGLPFLQTTASSVGLSSLNNNSSHSSNNEYTTTSRQFHASSTGKNKSPKAIFTCDLNAPWHLKNANDLGLLMFGITKNSLNTLKLMDLIAPRSRDMVFNRLNRGLELVFSGEIIAVKRDNRGLAWTSLWAKRKDNFIILIFEQVVCETIDIVIGKSNTPSSIYQVKSVIKQSKSLFHDDLLNKDLSLFAPSMDHVLSSSYSLENLSGLQTCTKDSTLINKIRYFTLKLSDSSLVPCAVTSEPLGDDPHDVESLIRINLHSLPYIAGSFVISSKNYEIVSFNEAIAKNLFGTGELKNQPVDTILPGFKKLLITAMEENPNLNYQEGLVLPEHYFRKLNAWKTGNTDEERESLFLNSKGLEGLHNDGNKIRVDVQLHIAEHNLFILWITFCRTFSSKVHKFPRLGGDKLSHMAISTASSDSSDSSNVPSQLKLMKQVENDIESVGSSSVDSLSRTSSIHTIDQSSLSSPITPKIARIQSASSRSNLITQQQVPQPQLIEASGKSDSDVSNNEDSLGASNFKLSKATSCALHLIEEEKHLTYLRLMCPHFPQTIGAERRIKKFSDFRVVKNLGQGAYGKVVIGEHKLDPIYRVCIKAIFKERILVDTWVRDRQLGTIPSEIQILNALNSKPHANIMRIVDFFEDENCYYLETLQHGDDGAGAVDLFDLIEVKNDMSEFEAKYIYFQIAAALEHMHKLGIVHRDIKDENMIVDKDYFVKVIDFGSAAYTKNAPFGVFVGTIDYAAPEVLNGQPYDGKAQDVWAMGVLLYTLVFKENPFCSVDEILDGELKFPIYGNGVSEECTDLIKSILITNVNKRPTMSDIMHHPWLKDLS